MFLLRSIRFTPGALRYIVVFITVHFPFAFYRVSIWCIPFYRGLHHGALFFPRYILDFNSEVHACFSIMVLLSWCT